MKEASMLDHIGIVVGDFDKSLAFYKAVLATLGVELIMQVGGQAGFGRGDHPQFWIYKGGPPSGRMHLAFQARNHDAVRAFHAAAMAAGAKDNGAPGLRAHYHPHYYGAFAIDLDGHNIEAVSHSLEA
jgi:catechol 2,3-dioxygenase-like lactoylglutathione lyase family enzyme